MFTFEDLARLDNNGVQSLLRQVEKDKLAWLLKARPTQCATCSSKTCPNARQDDARRYGRPGPGATGRCRRMQMMIVQLAKELASQGQIVISEGSGEDEMVY